MTHSFLKMVYKLPSFFILSIILTVTAGSLASADNHPEPKQALVVSGGLSLGSYQGGFAWAFLAAGIEGRSRGLGFELNTFTGASAGNINAMLGAISWCSPNFQMHAEKSLFWDAWTTTGIEQLLPVFGSESDARSFVKNRAKEISTGQSDGSDFPGIFSRDLFTGTSRHPDLPPTHLENLQAAINAGVRPGCKVDIGITTSMVAPESYEISPTNVKEQKPISGVVQRLPIAITYGDLDSISALKRPASGISAGGFYRLGSSRPEPRLNAKALKRMGLFAEPVPEDIHSDVISLTDIFSLAAASSAFPVAFSPVQLDLCLHRGDDSPRCSPYKGWFADGGVFDNKPLGLALDLAALAGEKLNKVLYIDQERRRTASGAMSATYLPQKNYRSNYGLSTIFAFLSGAIDSARQAQLVGVGRQILEGESIPPISASSRYPEVASDFLVAFSGFLGTPFRQHDFYAGVYDGLQTYSRDYVCGSETGRDQDRCVARYISRVILDRFEPLASSQEPLHIKKAGIAIILELCRLDFGTSCTSHSEIAERKLLNAKPTAPVNGLALNALGKNRQARDFFEYHILTSLFEAMEAQRNWSPDTGEPCSVSGDPVATRFYAGLNTFATTSGFGCMLDRFKSIAISKPQLQRLVGRKISNPASWCQITAPFIERQMVDKKVTCPVLAGNSLAPPVRNDLSTKSITNPILRQPSYFMEQRFQNLVNDRFSTLNRLQEDVLRWTAFVEQQISTHNLGTTSLGNIIAKGLLLLGALNNRDDDAHVIPGSTNTGWMRNWSLDKISLSTITPEYRPIGFWNNLRWATNRYGPSTLGTDLRNGGGHISWDIGALVSPSFRVNMRVTPLLKQTNQDPVGALGANLRWYSDELPISGLGIGTNFLADYPLKKFGASELEAKIFLLADRISIAAYWRFDEDQEWTQTGEYGVRFSLEDIGGLFYWVKELAD